MVDSIRHTTQSIHLPLFSSYTKRLSFSVIIGIGGGVIFWLFVSLASTVASVAVGVIGTSVALLLNSFAHTHHSETIWWSFLLGGQLLGAIGILLLVVSL